MFSILFHFFIRFLVSFLKFFYRRYCSSSFFSYLTFFGYNLSHSHYNPPALPIIILHFLSSIPSYFFLNRNISFFLLLLLSTSLPVLISSFPIFIPPSLYTDLSFSFPTECLFFLLLLFSIHPPTNILYFLPLFIVFFILTYPRPSWCNASFSPICCYLCPILWKLSPSPFSLPFAPLIVDTVRK